MWNEPVSRPIHQGWCGFGMISDMGCQRCSRKGISRFHDYLTMVHFRKVVIRQKVGSTGNRRPVIEHRCYMSTYYQYANDAGKETLRRDRQVREKIMVLFCDYFSPTGLTLQMINPERWLVLAKWKVLVYFWKKLWRLNWVAFTKMIRSHYDGISWSPSKKWKNRIFVADASARKKLLKTISSGIFHQQKK